VKASLVRELPTRALDFVDVPEPVPRNPDDIAIRVEMCGICGTDLHILDGHSYRPELPFVLGHEPVGTVVGGAPEWLGRRVAVAIFTGCGVCDLCRAGDERLCPDLVSITGVLNAWGGFAERVVVPAAHAVEVPEQISSAEAATLVDAGATAINAAGLVLAHGARRQSEPGWPVVVVGGGPVGLLVAERLRSAGVRSLVVEPLTPRREVLSRLGHETASSMAEVGGSPDAVVDAAGAPEILAWAAERLAPRGIHVLAGYSTVPAIDLAPFARKELTVRGVRSGSRAALAEALDLTARGELRLPPISIWPLSRINEAFAALRCGAVDGKAVIDVQG
jgi:2-desacetyl-2-hydroxyethyl bacteriochlorophyllide A dehydrogenase